MIMKKLISAALSVMLVFASSAPAAGQIYHPGQHLHLAGWMHANFNYLDRAIFDFTRTRGAKDIAQAISDTPFIDNLERHSVELKSMGPNYFDLALTEFNHDTDFRRFMENIKAGDTVKDAFFKVRPQYGADISKPLAVVFDEAREEYIKQMSDPKFLKSYTDALTFDELLDSFKKASNSAGMLKSRLVKMGVSDDKVYGAVLAEISGRLQGLNVRSDLFKDEAVYAARRIKEIEAALLRNPRDEKLKLEKRKHQNNKAFALRNENMVKKEIKSVTQTVKELYYADAKVAAAVDQMAPKLNKTLLKNIGAGAAAPGLLGVGIILVCAFIGVNMDFDAPVSNENYVRAINFGRSVDMAVTHTPHLVSAMYINANAQQKNIVAAMAFKDDNSARDAFLLNNELADALENISDAQLNKDIVYVKSALAEYKLQELKSKI